MPCCSDDSGSRQAKEPAPATGTNSATLASTALGWLSCAPAPCSRRLFLTLACRISRLCLLLQDGGVRSNPWDDERSHGMMGVAATVVYLTLVPPLSSSLQDLRAHDNPIEASATYLQNTLGTIKAASKGRGF